MLQKQEVFSNQMDAHFDHYAEMQSLTCSASVELQSKKFGGQAMGPYFDIEKLRVIISV